MRQEEQAFFEQLYLQLYDGLYRFVARIAKDDGAAEDLVQETFTEAFSRIDTLMAHPNVTGWFYLTARNKTLNYLRRKYHQEMTDLDLELWHPLLPAVEIRLWRRLSWRNSSSSHSLRDM